MRSMVHVYTGNGKGKTTSAFGLALRGVGAGKKVIIIQFVKGMEYSEVLAVKKYLPQIEIKQFGTGCFIFKNPADEDFEEAQKGFHEAKVAVSSGDYDIVILDELNIAVYYNLIDVEQVINMIKIRNDKTEVIITGRYADERLIEISDLVTEMKEVKHYYKKGVEARLGIEK